MARCLACSATSSSKLGNKLMTKKTLPRTRKYCDTCSSEEDFAQYHDGRELCDSCSRKKGKERRDKKKSEAETPREHAHRIWSYMKSRCLNKNNKSYHRYGGRGITIDPSWVNNFEQFYLDMGAPPDGMELDRIDNNGPYSKENCRWASVKEQSRNRRNNRPITINGETRLLVEWAEITGVNADKIYTRLKAGYTPEEAVSRKDSFKGILITINGETKTHFEWAAISGLPSHNIAERFRQGWEPERAVFEPIRAKAPRKVRNT